MTLLQADEVLKQRYRVIRLLGRGGMGCVYLAHDLERGLPVAVKSVSISQLDPSLQNRARAQFAHEARMLAHLDHRFLVKAHDHFEESGEGYIVMSHVEGADLATLMQERDKAYDFPTVLRMMEQLLEALDYLHSHKPPIIFRDLKPRNIMIDKKGDVCLVDFGIARLIEDETLTQSHLRGLGSPGFAPLEQYTHAGTDVRSDLYSLGATVYFLLSNKSPASPIGIVAGDEVLQPLTDHNPGIPDWFNRLVMRMLSLARENRPATARSILDEVRAGGTAGCDSTEALQKPPPAAAPRRRPWTAMAVVALVVGGLAATRLAGHPARGASPGPGLAVSTPDWVLRLEAGQSVRLEPGTYEIPSGIRLRGNVVLNGAGPEQTHILLKRDPPVLEVSQTGSCRLEGVDFVYQGTQFGDVVEIRNHSVDIRDCRFQGAIRDLQAARAGSGLRLSGNTSGSVLSCQANANAKNGIQVRENSSVTVANCSCHENGYAGLAVIDSGQATMKENHSSHNRFGILLLDRASADVSRNECQDNDYGLALFDGSQASAQVNTFVNNRKSGWARTPRAILRESHNRLEGPQQPQLDPSLRPR